MDMYKYNGVKLPALPDWLTSSYPYAFICMEAQICKLVVVDKIGYIGKWGADHAYGPDYTLGAYELNESEEKKFTRCSWIVARSEDAAVNMAGTYPGISATEWLVSEENYTNIWCDTLSGGILWSNHDILNEDGTLHIAASEPKLVKEFCLKSFLCGLALGLSGKPLPLSSKTPIGYSYNGTVLPKLPEWDRESYPFAYIWQTSSGKYAAVFVATPLYYSGGLYSNGVTTYRAYEGITESGEWGSRIVEGNYSVGVNVTLIWCNTDVYDNTGETLYLAASEPVPVYE